MHAMSMKAVFAALLGLALLCCAPQAQAARRDTMPEPQTIALVGRASTPLDADATRAAIIAGASQAGWTVQSESPGRIDLRLVVRAKHEVVVAAVYSAGQVRFDYLDSTNMNSLMRPSGAWAIHPSYMLWLGELEDAVRMQAARR